MPRVVRIRVDDRGGACRCSAGRPGTPLRALVRIDRIPSCADAESRAVRRTGVPRSSPAPHDGAVGPDDGGRCVAAAQPAGEFACRLRRCGRRPRACRVSALLGGRRHRRDEAKPLPRSASRRRPSASTGLGHSVPASCRGLRDRWTSAERRRAGVLLSRILARSRGSRCSRGTTTRRIRLPNSPPGGHRPADAEGEPDHAAGVRFSLLLVGVEDVGGQVAREDAGQLPRQVHRVAQAGAHALADERRGEVGGVAEQEDAAAPPAVGELGAEGVLGDADQFESSSATRADPRRDQRPQRVEGVEVVGGLAGQQPELPAVAGLADAHVGARADGVAHLVHALPLVEVGRSVATSTTSQRCSNPDPPSRNRFERGRCCWRRRSRARSRPRRRARDRRCGRRR